MEVIVLIHQIKKRKDNVNTFETAIMERMDNELEITNLPGIEDSDMLFLRSIYESTKQLNEQRKALLKMKLREIMYNAEFGKI